MTFLGENKEIFSGTPKKCRLKFGPLGLEVLDPLVEALSLTLKSLSQWRFDFVIMIWWIFWFAVMKAFDYFFLFFTVAFDGRSFQVPGCVGIYNWTIEKAVWRCADKLRGLSRPYKHSSVCYWQNSACYAGRMTAISFVLSQIFSWLL